MRPILILLLLAAPARAQTPILLALRANGWALAQTLAGKDPLGQKLVTFIRLLNPGQATPAELARFMADNPAWPDRPTLERRYAEALAAAPEAGLCRSRPAPAAAALAACASLLRDPALARAAWAAGATIAASPTPADEQGRFDTLEKTDPAAAARQIARLAPQARALATARLAFRQNTPGALGTLAAIPAEQRADTGLLLAEARYLRRAHADEAALALWRSSLPAAEAATPQAQRAPFWAERDALAHRLLAQGDAAAAFLLASDSGLATDQAVEATFLSGWIALRYLHDPVRARTKFQTLREISRSAISQARALYWLARAAADAAAAHALFQQAAAWPLTYYGQLAAIAAGGTPATVRSAIAGQQDPAASLAEAAAFAAGEPARAASILASWGDPRRAADFLAQIIQPPATLPTRAMAASLALRLGLPDVAVQAARLAGRDGTVLPRAGWPAPFTPPAGDVAESLSLAIMRQESSFSPSVVSPAGAVGLMQLIPGTAEETARRLHTAAGPLTEPSVNMRLGTAYLAGLIAQSAPCLPCAIAAYNAGPHRALAWGTAAAGEAMVDWIEAIPLAETRNYVQRVLENQMVYEARGY